MMLEWVLSTYLMSLLLIQCLAAEPLKARLVNGTKSAGRLEIYFNGQWGTVVSHQFGNDDARVACRMLGFYNTEAAAVDSVLYGQGSGPILLANMYCKGEETSLDKCSHSVFYPQGWTHQSDVGVICNITEPLKARLVNGTKSAGRLEIYFNGQWGTVVNNDFGSKDAQVACRMLGFYNTEAAVVGSVLYGQGSGPILLSSIYCKGDESSLEQCSHSVFYPHGWSHRGDVGVICNITLEPLKARLVNGTKTAGRLEIYFNGEWGTVSYIWFRKEDARVACRMLGFNNTKAAIVGSVLYGQGSGPILLSGIYCKGEETSLEQCSHSVLYPPGWSHQSDVGVICSINEPLKARLVNGTKSAGRLEILFNGQWGTVVNNHFGNDDARVACRMLGFNNLDRQTKTLSQTDKNTIKSIASHEHSGLRFACSNLQLYEKDNKNLRFTEFPAITEAAVVDSVLYGQGSGPILLYGIYCKGEETSLEQCSHSVFYPPGWSHQSDVGVICSTSEPMKARLVNGTKSAGRLEIYFNGQWGTVVNHEFGKDDARVACRMLGFNNTKAAVVGSVLYGQGLGPILLSRIYCKGEETSLEQCSHDVFYPHGWTHKYDVGVICNISEPIKVRLVNGTKSAGRLELYFNGQWGTVVNHDFGKDDARVACRMLGFNNTEAAIVGSVLYGQGSGPILLSRIYCKGEETSLEQCPYDVFYPHGWSHEDDVGVICNITEPLKARLVNGTKSAGRLEIYFNGQWGTVTNNGFGKDDARVACRMLGFNNLHAAVVDSDIYGKGSGPILLTSIYCKGEETSLEQCYHSVFYPHGWTHESDVGVVCSINEPMKARLVNGTKSAGRLEIYFSGKWGTVSNNGFEKKDAQVACRMLGFNIAEAAVVDSDIYGQGSGPILLTNIYCKGDETSLEQCSHSVFYPKGWSHRDDVGVNCNITEPMKARLVNGTRSAGRLEIYFNGEWGTVYSNGFEKDDARVACRMLGFNNTEAAVVDSDIYGQGSGPIMLTNIYCQGDETSLEQCSHSVFYPHGWSHRADVGIICNITTAEPMKARLVNGTLEAGRLEIYFNGEWGTVCGNGFGKKDARVVCRMLGYGNNEAALVSSVRYGQGSGPILLDDMGCRGLETSLDQCSHSGFYPHGCTHRKDGGVICNITEPMKARLVNGTMAAGRLEIYFNGEWGTVCNKRFRKKDAQVACRMLGFNNTEVAVVGSDRYGQGSGPILLGHVGCRGFETNLEHCSHSGFYPHRCTHRKDVGVNCNINKTFTEEDETKGTGSSVDNKGAIFGGGIAGVVVLAIVVIVIVVCILRRQKDGGFQRTDFLSDADPPDFPTATVQSSRC